MVAAVFIKEFQQKQAVSPVFVLNKYMLSSAHACGKITKEG